MSIISDIMARTSPVVFPAGRKQFTVFGERLRLARRRRRLSTVLMAERAGISRDTLNRVEKGDPAVSLGTYLRVMRVLGLDADLDLLARDDVLGRKLQDLALEPRSRRSL
jgi:transcriptional regulator with XRE-family HTH domain